MWAAKVSAHFSRGRRAGGNRWRELDDVTQAWKDIAGNLPVVHGMSPGGLGAARRRSHGKIVLRVDCNEQKIRGRAYELYLARGAQPSRELEDWLQAERELTSKPHIQIDSEPEIAS